MCGRFTLRTPANALATLFDLTEEPALAPRFNIAPTQPVAIVRLHPQSHQREWHLVQWGLVPSWSKDPSIGARMINARSETASEKPSFRAAFKRRRCLVPSDGFYEWQRRGGSKQPFYIHMADGGPFAFAGLWEQWVAPDGGELETCTILTCEPNELVEPLHDRMPVILAPEDYAEWLGTGSEQDARELSVLRHLLRPYLSAKMAAYAVSSYVNSPAHEGAECIQSL